MDDEESTVINVYAGSSDGAPVHEELPAKKLSDGSYLLLSSPGITLNLAKGDIVSIVDKNSPARVLKRGGNFCIQIYCADNESFELTKIENTVNKELDGTLDGVNGKNIAFSVPAKSGIENIRRVFDQASLETGAQWFYGNIYKNFENVSDGTLLSWWSEE